ALRLPEDDKPGRAADVAGVVVSGCAGGATTSDTSHAGQKIVVVVDRVAKIVVVVRPVVRDEDACELRQPQQGLGSALRQIPDRPAQPDGWGKAPDNAHEDASKLHGPDYRRSSKHEGKLSGISASALEGLGMMRGCVRALGAYPGIPTHICLTPSCPLPFRGE